MLKLLTWDQWNWTLNEEKLWKYIVAYSLKARVVESQQLAITKQRPVSNNRGMVFSTQSVLRCSKQDQLAVAVS
jgi:hypothetical protein